jgi:hypothetical protein
LRELQKVLKASQIVASPEAVSVDLSSNGVECVVILSLVDGVYYEIQGFGARLWEMVQTPLSFEELLNAILEEYEVEEERCAADLTVLLTDLHERGLVEVRSQGTSGAFSSAAVPS